MFSSRWLLLPLLGASGLLASCASTRLGTPPAVAAPAEASVGASSAAFPFEIPWNDTTKTPLDVSFLNSVPAGGNGFIVARGEHFVESKTGKRIRFIGANFTWADGLKDKRSCEQVAARMAKYGINYVRFHFFDRSDPFWGTQAPSAFWKDENGAHVTIKPETLDLFDYFIAQLKRNGIYSNWNLKVTRTFSPEDGFPESVKNIRIEFHKRVDMFDARMIELQKDFARQLLTHRNPYTGLEYRNDPGVFCIETNNEASLTSDDGGEALLTLPEPFRGELQEKWNRWLRRKYPSTPALQNAWKSGGALGQELLRDPKQLTSWNVEQHDPARIEARIEDGALYANVSQIGLDWHAQLKQEGLDLKEGETYTLRFRAKSDTPRGLNLSVSRDVDDWRSVGVSQTLQLSPEWKEFSYTFPAASVVPGHTRLVFALGTEKGAVWIRDASLRAGGAAPALSGDQTLERQNVPLPAVRVGQVGRDWLAFLADTEFAFARQMRDYLKKDLGVRSMVIISQTEWGSVAPYRERAIGAEFRDNHAYWDLPQTKGTQWDPVGAFFLNTPMTPGMNGANPLSVVARMREAGTPYFVSEYNHPFANEFNAECLPLVSTFGAFQDFDGFSLHEYGTFPLDHTNHYYSVAAEPSKMGFLPFAALAFRNFAFAPAKTREVRALPPMSQAQLNVRRTFEAVWPDADLKNRVLGQRIAISVPGSAQPNSAQPESSARSIRGDSSLQLVGQGERAIYQADAPAVKAVTGRVANSTVRWRGALMNFGALANDFAAVGWASYDAKPLASSAKVLLTAMARSSNTGQTWNEGHKSLSALGTGPTLVDGVSADVSLATTGPRTVYALDATGAVARKVEAKWSGGLLRFSIAPTDKTIWYLISPSR